MKRRVRKMLWYAIPVLSLVLIVVAAYQWRRSFRVLDQRAYAWMRIDPTPQNVPPTPKFNIHGDDVYPPGTQSYRGTFRQWRCDTFNGRILFRFGHRTSAYAKPETPEPLKRYLGWERRVAPIQDAISYNIPRGNEYTSIDNFHWNGLGSWHYHINGDVAQLVMVPHWMLLCVASLPTPVWLIAFLARRRTRKGHCPHCKYDCRGITGPCPECGTPVT